MQKQIFSTIVIVASFFGSLVWAEDKIMLCSGDENYGSHSSLGIEGYKDATVFVRMRTHLLREPSIHYRIGLGDWKKWCSGGVVEVQGNTAICERVVVKRLMPPPIEEDAKWFERQLKLMRPELCGWLESSSKSNAKGGIPNFINPFKYPHCKSLKLVSKKDTVSSYHFPWFNKQTENLVISFTSLTVNHSSRRVFTDRVGNSFQDSFSSNQECQIP